ILIERLLLLRLGAARLLRLAGERAGEGAVGVLLPHRDLGAVLLAGALRLLRLDLGDVLEPARRRPLDALVGRGALHVGPRDDAVVARELVVAELLGVLLRHL